MNEEAGHEEPEEAMARIFVGIIIISDESQAGPGEETSKGF